MSLLPLFLSLLSFQLSLFLIPTSLYLHSFPLSPFFSQCSFPLIEMTNPLTNHLFFSVCFNLLLLLQFRIQPHRVSVDFHFDEDSKACNNKTVEAKKPEKDFSGKEKSRHGQVFGAETIQVFSSFFLFPENETRRKYDSD